MNFACFATFLLVFSSVCFCQKPVDFPPDYIESAPEVGPAVPSPVNPKLYIDVENLKSFDEFIEQGELKGFFTLDQVEEMISQLRNSFPELFLPVEIIGKSYEGRDMRLYCLTKNDGQTTLEQAASTKAIALVTALHHPRELVSLSMLAYSMYRIVYEYHKNNKEYVPLLDDNILCLLPAVNPDGYNVITEHYRKTNQLIRIRKNRNNSEHSKCRRDIDIGVDLNRNYGYRWDQDDEGSSTKPCAEDFRGATPFSEPETQAIRDFIGDYKNEIKLVVNLHAYGNLWVYPFNCYVNETQGKSKRVIDIFDDFRENAPLPEGAKVGNAKSTVTYTANGESSDWILGEHNIIAYSPEIGLHEAAADDFFPKKELIHRLLEGNFPGIYYMLSKLNPSVEFISIEEKKIETRNNITGVYLKVHNLAYRDMQNATITIDFSFSVLRPEFMRNTRGPEVELIQNGTADANSFNIVKIDPSKLVLRSDPHSWNVKYSLTQDFTFKSWAELEIAIVIPYLHYDGLHMELIIIENDYELFRFADEFSSPFPWFLWFGRSRRWVFLAIAIAIGVILAGIVLYIIKRYKRMKTGLTTANIYGGKQPELEFAQISSVEELDGSSRV